MLSGAVASLPFISLGFFEGEDLHELPDQDQGHGNSFLRVRAGFHDAGTSAGTSTNIEPGNGTAAGEFYALREPAAAGDAQAQFALGNHYFHGLGVPQDYGQALIWYRKSAAQGYALAQNQLGYMRQHKFGLPRDYKRALNYYRLAANKVYALAEYNLAAMYQSKPSNGTARRRTRIFRMPRRLSATLSVRTWGQERQPRQLQRRKPARL